MNNEIYKEKNNFSNYEISNYGNIKNKINQKILKSCIKSVKIHHLVALHFLQNPLKKETLNHKDHNRLNNKIDNLEWTTITEQNNHKRKCKKKFKN